MTYANENPGTGLGHKYVVRSNWLMQWDPKLPLLDNWISNGIIHIQQQQKIFAFQNYNVGNKNIKENMAFFHSQFMIQSNLL